MEQENKTYTDKICGNCDAFCECGLNFSRRWFTT